MLRFPFIDIKLIPAYLSGNILLLFFGFHKNFIKYVLWKCPNATCMNMNFIVLHDNLRLFGVQYMHYVYSVFGHYITMCTDTLAYVHFSIHNHYHCHFYGILFPPSTFVTQKLDFLT